MVGVAGKSRACKNCRKRRVECDLLRPCCARCLKANIICIGYNKETIFVNRHPTSMSTTATTVLSDKRKHQLRHRNFDNRQTVRLYSFPEAQVPEFSQFVKGRIHAVQLLKQIYLPQGFVDDGINGIKTCFSWLLEISELTGASQSLDAALYSLYMSQVYASGSTATSLEACLDIYNTALQKLREDLQDPEVKLRDETLASIVLISTNELFVNPIDNAWEAHTNGISEILKLRNSLKAGDSVRPNLCSRLHAVCVLNAIIKRRSLILTNQDWRRLKYGNNHCLAGEFDRLIDILGELPVLMEETEGLLKQSNISAPWLLATPLMQSYASISERLYSWQEQLRGTSDTPLYWAMPSSLSHAPERRDAENLFPLILHFRSPNAAIPLILSWAVLVQIYCSLSRIYEFIEQNSPGDDSDLSETSSNYEDNQFDATNPVGLPPRLLIGSHEWPSKAFCITEGDKLVRFLCQSMEYCHQISMGMLGPQVVTYPQWIARRYFRFRPGYERELKWFHDFKTMTGLGFRCGVKVMDFGDDIGYNI